MLPSGYLASIPFFHFSIFCWFTTDIKADVYTTDMSINVDLNEFNSSTNLSWEGGFSKVYISEVALAEFV